MLHLLSPKTINICFHFSLEQLTLFYILKKTKCSQRGIPLNSHHIDWPSSICIRISCLLLTPDELQSALRMCSRQHLFLCTQGHHSSNSLSLPHGIKLLPFSMDQPYQHTNMLPNVHFKRNSFLIPSSPICYHPFLSPSLTKTSQDQNNSLYSLSPILL